MENKAIKAGDVVILLSGSPLMVVVEVLPGKARCCWWHRKAGPTNTWIPVSILVVVPDSNDQAHA